MSKKSVTYYRYSLCFKQTVIEELKKGLSVSEVQRKYGVRESSTITRWAKALGAGSLLNEVIYVKMRNETDELKRLKQEVQRLKIALADKTLAHDALESLLEVAGIDVAALKKNTGPGRSGIVPGNTSKP
jgi:transposase-like protein